MKRIFLFYLILLKVLLISPLFRVDILIVPGVDNFVFSHYMVLNPLQEVLKIISYEALVVEIILRIVLRVAVEERLEALFSLFSLLVVTLLPGDLLLANALEPANFGLGFLSFFSFFACAFGSRLLLLSCFVIECLIKLIDSCLFLLLFLLSQFVFNDIG